jgi:hypothetical protein
VQDGRVVAGGEDRLERERVAAVAQERRLEVHLQLALGGACGDQLHQRREAGAGRRLGRAHALELDLVLGAADADERVAQLDVGVRARAERACGPAGKPLLQLVQWPGAVGDALAVAVEPGPQQLLGGDRRDELDPAVAWRVGEHATGALAVREVEVLGVRAERIRAVAAPRHGDLIAGVHEHDAAVEVPGRRGRRAPPLEEARPVHGRRL